MTFYVENENNFSLPFSAEELFKKIALEVLKEEGFEADVQVNMMIVSLDEIHKMNMEYRNIDRPTDVLSFPNLSFSKPGQFDLRDTADIIDPETNEIILGDIIICYDKIKEQAAEYGHSLLREFSFLTAHSMLHLCGYDHMEESDAVLMEQRQKDVLDKLNLTRDCL